MHNLELEIAQFKNMVNAQASLQSPNLFDKASVLQATLADEKIKAVVSKELDLDDNDEDRVAIGNPPLPPENLVKVLKK